MKRTLLLLALLGLSSASAQSSEFVGGAVTFDTGAAEFFQRDDVGVLPETLFFELQAGDYTLFGPFGFREVIGIDLLTFDHLELGGDVLYTVLEWPRVYLGVGAGLTAGAGTITCAAWRA